MKSNNNSKISTAAIKIIVVTVSASIAAFVFAVVGIAMEYQNSELMAKLGIRIIVLGFAAAIITDIVKRADTNSILK